MRTLFFSMICLLSSTIFLSAQDFYLPVSTTSDIAQKAYHKAVDLGANLNFKAARAQIEKALEADPHFLMAYAYAVQVYASPEEKAKLIDEALALDGTTFNQAEGIMWQQLQAWDKDPKALPSEAMKALVAAYPRTPQAYEWASLHAAYTEGNVEAALEYALQLEELSPEYAPNYNTLGYLYLGKKQMAKAKAAFEKYIALAPGEANPYDSMGEYYMVNGEYTESAKYYEQAAALGMANAKERADKARAMVNQKG